MLEMAYLICVLVEVRRGKDVSWILFLMSVLVYGMGAMWLCWWSRDVALAPSGDIRCGCTGS